MFDGLLGRGGFSSKCKPLIKVTRTRIDVIQRKRNATLKFLKKDVADLLSTGLHTNALGRAEGLIAELCVTSCYDFLDQVCEIILKHLSTMSKIRECPEDCREAVASLIFSAARFSDLPELRELREIFKDRFGNSLECYVSQKLVDYISPKPTDMDKKLKLLEDIASEFSVAWDRSAFEQRNREDKQKFDAYLHPAENKYKASHVLESVQKIDNKDPRAKIKIEVHQRMKVRDTLDSERHKLFIEEEPGYSRNKPPAGSKAVQRSKDPVILPKKEFMVDGRSSFAQENGNLGKTDGASRSGTGRADDRHNLTGGQKVVPVSEHQIAAHQVKAEPLLVKAERHVESVGHVKHSKDNTSSPVGKLPGEEIERVRPNIRSNIPPPYVKPKKSKHRSRHSESDTLTFGAPNPAPVKDEIPHYTVEYYRDVKPDLDPTPRRRPRRKHSKQSSTPSENDNPEEVRVVRRVSTSRRRDESKKGLQILFDEDHPRGQSDDEERMMDKLLLHYSKRAAGGKTKSSDAKEDPQHPSRSMSLPHEQSSSEMKKVFTRAASFNQEASTPAKHVHPKLPDCDDLAARFAALRRG